MPKNVVVLAPHCDDETLGLGGTIRKHVEAGDRVSVVVATGGSDVTHPVFPKGYLDNIQREAQAAMKVLCVDDLIILGMEPVTYPEEPRYKTNKIVHDVLQDLAPDTLYVPFPYDLHNDHRALFHSASVAWRPNSQLGQAIRRVFAYEVVSETHWQATAFEPAFAPTVWSSLSEGQLSAKMEALACYSSQMGEFPATRSLEAVQHLARWRGSQVGVPAAESFVLVRALA